MSVLISLATEDWPLLKTALVLARSKEWGCAMKGGLLPTLVEWTLSNLGVQWSGDFVANLPNDRQMQVQLDTPQIGTSACDCVSVCVNP